jgi:23S rRNA pseudouridine2605 synthase
MGEMEERIQKIMAQSGIGSRRDCEVLIITGRVYVNGVVAIIGQKANPKIDKIVVDGKAVNPPAQKMYFALHKPRGVLSTIEAEPGDRRRTVRDLLPVGERLYPVGRLDFDSEGLVLMTNDGDLAQKLTHPSHEHEKEYRVLVASQPDDDQLGKWRRGVVMEDGYKTLPAEVRVEGAAGKGSWLRIIMKEGKKRQIREIGSLIGLPVVRIIRIRIGALMLGALKPGEFRPLSSLEITALKSDASMPVRSRPVNRNGRRFSPSRSQEHQEGHPPRRARPGSDRPQEQQNGYPPRRTRPDSDRPQEQQDGRPPRRAARPGSDRPQEQQNGYPPRRARPGSDRPQEQQDGHPPRKTRPASAHSQEQQSGYPPRRTRPASARSQEQQSGHPPRRTRPASARPKK